MSEDNLEPRPPVEPKLHPPEEVEIAVQRGNHDSLVIRETIAALATQSRWRELWIIADSMSKEVSVLVDSAGMVWADVGTRGEVRLAPPRGSVIPYRFWLHSHPQDGYWSSTDCDSLACYSMILDEAIVLGHDHLKRTRRTRSPLVPVLGPGWPLSTWTDEPIVLYSDLGGPYVR